MEKDGRHLFLRSLRALIAVIMLVAVAASSAFADQNANAAGSFLDVGGGKIYYEECGTGPEAVLLVHDGVVNSAVWNDVWPTFCKNFHTIRYDRRGYGRSPVATHWYTETDDILALLRHLKIQRTLIVGSSHGGELSIEFTIAHPNLVEEIVLVGAVVHGYPFSDHMMDRGLATRAPIDKSNDISTEIARIANDKYLTAPDHPAARKKIHDLLTAAPQDVTHADMTRDVPSSLPRLHEIYVPVLILVGDADIPDVHAHAGAIETGIPNARRIVVRDTGHLMYLEKPEEFASIVIDFLLEHAYAQPVKAFDADVIRDWHTAKLFTLAVADAMPADKYDFRVTPDVRSFGELMIHIATSQAERFAQISGARPPFNVDEKSQKAGKADVLHLLTQSFDFCIAQLDSLTPAQLEKNYVVEWYERPEVSGREMVTAMFVHTAHHRAQAEVYLRANGITPPVYRF